MANFMKYISCIITAALWVTVSGCSAYERAHEMAYDRGEYEKSYKHSKSGVERDQRNALLRHMNGAFLLFQFFHPAASIEQSKIADEEFNQAMQGGLLSSINKTYKGSIYEGAYINFYQALAYSSIGDKVQARVAFNRANDRERMAKDYYHREIQKVSELNKNAMSNHKNQSAHRDSSTGRSTGRHKTRKHTVRDSTDVDGNVEQIIQQRYSNLEQFMNYQNFVNPIIPYMSGIFFMQEGDYSKATDLLKQAYGITGSSNIARDIELMENRRSRGDSESYTWIMVEDGDIARKISHNISIPMIIDGKLINIAVAIPELTDGKQKYKSYSVDSGEFQMITNVSDMLEAEFAKQIRSIIAKEIVGAIIKGAATYVASSAFEDEVIGMLISIVLSLIIERTNNADTRLSITLPNSVHVARVKNKHGTISVHGDGKRLLSLSMDNECGSLQKRQKIQGEIHSSKDKKKMNILSRLDDGKLCSESDNIVYIRVRAGTTKHFIVKGR